MTGTAAVEPALDARDLYRFFHSADEETQALRGVSISVRSGELIAVTGPSGSGKSTLLGCLAGLDDPDGGQVRIAGRVLSRRSELERARIRADHVGVLFQSDNLLAHLDLEGNLRTVQRLRGGHPSGAARHEILERLGLSHRRRAHPSELSGGEAARAGLAVALVNHPDVLLADEPTGEVDSTTEAHVLSLIRDRAREGAAVLVVTHSRSVAAVADRVVHLVDGRVQP
jgi:putative ABC transport system ATP-binding protein